MNIEKERQKDQSERGELLLPHTIARRGFLAKSLVVGAGIIGLSQWEGQIPVFAATLGDARLAPHAGDPLHICGRGHDGRLYHTIRFANGSWQSAFGDVNAQESNGGNLNFTDVDSAGIGGNLHVTAISNAGIIWHTIRFANGSWASAFGNVNAQESNGNALSFRELGCAGTSGGDLQVTARADDGVLWHTIRFANGGWAPAFGNINDQESNGNAVRFGSVDCATINDDLHVCGVDQSGIIWHTIRFANGSWAPAFGDVNAQESNGSRLRFTEVGCASIGGNLHVTAVARNGVIWHTIRFANGSWAPAFGNVNAQESNGRRLRFIDVDCANEGGNLHVTAVARNGVIWHTIRFANGSWATAFGNVNAQESNGNNLSFASIGASGVD